MATLQRPAAGEVITVVEGDHVDPENFPPTITLPEEDDFPEEDDTLPQCKIKRNYLCTACHYFTQNPRFYLYHLRDAHNAKMKIYECPHCLYASKHSQKLSRHVNMVHDPHKPSRRQSRPKGLGRRKRSKGENRSSPPTLTQPLAAADAKQKSAKGFYIERDDDENDDDSNDRLVIQDQPEEERTSESPDEEQVLGTSDTPYQPGPDGDYQCSVCTFQSRSMVLISRHERVVHLKKKFFRCRKCSYVTHLKARYTKHVKYHTMPLIKCSICDFRTPYKWNLDRHLKNHGGTGRHRCCACDFAADIKQSLTVHELNHHVPPVGNAVNGNAARQTRRRNKVGASECVDVTEEDTIDRDELELLRLEREDRDDREDEDIPERQVVASQTPDEASTSGVGGLAAAAPTDLQSPTAMTTDLTARTKPPLRCAQCGYRSAFISDMSRHLAMNHGKTSKAAASPTPDPSTQAPPSSTSTAPSKRVVKPLPNLIPIQSKTPQKPASTASAPEKVMSERDMNDICAKSCPTSSLKDFASVIGDESAFQTPEDETETTSRDGDQEIRESPVDQDAFKKKNASFFDQLKEKLMTSTGQFAATGASAADPSSLVCVWCGHEAKCLSELVRHQKLHNGQSRGVSSSVSSSTRCQHCRHRCKSSADLVAHLKTCPKAVEDDPGDDAKDAARDIHPMENKVFVWNMPGESDNNDEPGLQQQKQQQQRKQQQQQAGASSIADIDNTADEAMDDGEEFPEAPDDDEAMDGETCHDGDDGNAETDSENAEFTIPTADHNLLCVETAPGYGSVTTQAEYEVNAAQARILHTVTSVKKVFKCPHCTFWASTASRFHVHIVGHLNKKPFECSYCNYRSNWRWDITKHIRLKAVRDPCHDHAKVLMTDETGRRNYSKYNKHLSFMRVAEPSAENLISPRQSKAAANGMQGNAEPVPILPAPPKLTRAPVPRSNTQAPPQVPGSLLRPPPPLQAATHLIILNTLPPGVRLQQPQLPVPPLTLSQQQQQEIPVQQGQKALQQSSQQKQQGHAAQQLHQQQPQTQQGAKRPADESGDVTASDPKRINSDIKKTVWRCKQCHFRDGDRQVVLAHVKGHYRANQEAAMRLAKLKNAGIVISPKSSEVVKHITTQQPKKSVAQTSPGKKGGIQCEICPFVASSESALIVHNSHHKMKQDAIFKCYMCPFYVNSKADLVLHMNVHGETNKEDFMQKTVRIKTVNSNSSDETQSDQSNRFSNPASQPTGMDVDGEEAAQPPAPDLELGNLAETPICWVLRYGKLTKMYKCRSCPHVNMRKTNIGEHERMHSKRSFINSNGLEIPHANLYPCTSCSYVCNNAGVLSSHSKVHDITYPRAYGFVDPYRSDEEQIRELSEKYSIPLESDTQIRDGISVKDGKLNGINIMSLLNPNQSITDAVLGMKKKFNLDLDGEPFAEPQEDQSESPPCSPLKQINEELTPALVGLSDDKKLHFCQQCPARFLFRKELGIHARFHNLHLVHRCESCSYTARQRTHLQAHYKVHTDEYQERTKELLKRFKVHHDFQMPRTAALAEVPGLSGPVWIVVNAVTKKKTSETGPTFQQKVASQLSPQQQAPEQQLLQHQTPPQHQQLPHEQHSSQQSLPALSNPPPNQIEDENGKLKFCCPKCPATFFKMVALEYHATLHGGNGPHKCRTCDYAVKTYGNLVKHMSMHGKKEISSKQSPASKSHRDSARSVPLSGTELFQQRIEANEKRKGEEISSDSGDQQEEPTPDREEGKENKREDSVHDALINGSPDFVYPTYLKNGRVREKRYKCHKCPSAFEKRDQYTLHLALHGSNQRYVCHKCDYSVKYYANHVQHMQKHKSSENAKAAKGANNDLKMSNRSDSISEVKPEVYLNNLSNGSMSTPISSAQRSVKSTGGSGEKLSVADKQAFMVMQQRQAKRAPVSRETIDKNYWCLHCPYSNPRRDQVENHMKKHICVSGTQNTFTCEHCDFSGPNKHHVREHMKLHFDVSKTPRPDAYMIYDGLELYANTDSRKNDTRGKILVFQDKGSSADSDRFLPTLSDEKTKDENSNIDRVFIDLNTLEPDGRDECPDKELIDTIEGRSTHSESDYENEIQERHNSIEKDVEDNQGSSSSPVSSIKTKAVASRSNSPCAVNGLPTVDEPELKSSSVLMQKE